MYRCNRRDALAPSRWGRLSALASKTRAGGIKTCHVRDRLRDNPHERCCRYKVRYLRVTHCESKPLAWRGRVERKVCTASFQHGEQRDDEVDGAVEAHRNQRLCPDTLCLKVAREAVSSSIEIRVINASLAISNRNAVGEAESLLGEKLVKRAVEWSIRLEWHSTR